MNQATRERYRAIRGRHPRVRAADAYRLASAEPMPYDGWDGFDAIAWDQDGFRMVATADYDDCPDLSWIGEYSNDWRPGCIDVRKAGACNRRGPIGWRYFHPATEYRHGDWALMKKLESEEASVVVVKVTASRAGVVLGTDYLGSVWREWGADFCAEDFLPDMADEAIREANHILQALCQS